MIKILLLCTLVSASQATGSVPVVHEPPALDQAAWQNLVQWVIKEGKLSPTTKEGATTFTYTVFRKGTVDRLMILVRVVPNGLDLLGVGLSHEIWLRTGQRVDAWLVDRWVLAASPLGILREKDYDIVHLGPNQNLIKVSPISSRSGEDLTVDDRVFFQSVVAEWELFASEHKHEEK